MIRIRHLIGDSDLDSNLPVGDSTTTLNVAEDLVALNEERKNMFGSFCSLNALMLHK